MDMFEEQDIYREYPKEKKPSGKKIALIVIAAVLVLALVAGGAFFGGTLYAGSQSIESDMPMVKAVIDALNKYYIEDINWEELQYMIAQAIAGNIDPYTGLVESTPIGMKTKSVGITFEYDDYCRYYISEIAPGSPAATTTSANGSAVKLMIGDEVVAINGKDVRHLNSSAFSQYIASIEDEMQIVVYRRNGDSIVGQYTFDLQKTMFHAPLAYYLDSDVTGMPSNVGYIKLTEFGDTASEDFAAAVNEFLSDPDKPNKLVLDLRGNGGGSVQICGFIASYFVKQNGTNTGIPMARYEYNSGNGKMLEEYFYTSNTYTSEVDDSTLRSVNLYDEVGGFDCVVLVNGRSASSSELLTATLSYYSGIKSIGSKTYGKGVAQVVIPYSNGKYELYITNGKYYIPSLKDGKTVFETNIHGVGITPDIISDASGIYYMAVDPCLRDAAEYLTTVSSAEAA